MVSNSSFVPAVLLAAILPLFAGGCNKSGGGCKTSKVTVVGPMQTDLGQLEFTLADAELKHRMDVDEWEDGLVTEVRVTLQRDNGCRLDVVAKGCQNGTDSLPVTSIELHLDAHCPGMPQEREGLYLGSEAGTLGIVTLGTAQVPGREQESTCFESQLTVLLNGQLINAGNGSPLAVQPTEIVVSGTFRSAGDYTTSQNCATVIDHEDVRADLARDDLVEPADTSGPAPTVTLKVTCEECETDASLRLRANKGWDIGTPDYLMLFEKPEFPFEVTLELARNPAGDDVPWAEGDITFQAWQDVTPGGAVPEAGEPLSALSTETLVTGHINLVELALAVDERPDVDCAPDSDYCLSLYVSAHCNETGDDYAATECGDDHACSETTGLCREVVCVPSKTVCADAGSTRTCLPSGTGFANAVDCQDGYACLNGTCIKEECLAEVLFLVDTSGSMALDWSAVAQSLASLTVMSPTASFGMLHFPTYNDVCTISSQPVVPLAPDQSGAIIDWFDDNVAFGQTPLLTAMEAMVNVAPGLFTSGQGALVLLSDGADTCAYPELSLEERETLIVQGLGSATQTLWQDHGIRTYVIGYQYQGSEAQLNAIATNGGTGAETYTQAGNESELTNVLVAIGEDLKLCFE